jgi:hypothetical protein
MPDDAIDERLRAVERALSDGNDDATLPAGGETDVEERIADLEARMEDLEAAVRAIRGYVGNVRSINRDVERRADAALAKARAVETALDEREAARRTGRRGHDTITEDGTRRGPDPGDRPRSRDETVPSAEERLDADPGRNPDPDSGPSREPGHPDERSSGQYREREPTNSSPEPDEEEEERSSVVDRLREGL